MHTHKGPCAVLFNGACLICHPVPGYRSPHSHAAAGRGGPRWDGRFCHLLKNLIHYCSSQRTRQFVNTPAWNSRSIYLSTYRHTANIPHGARNPKHLLTRQLLLLPVAFWGLPDQKSLGRHGEMVAAGIMKWTPHKAADLNVYNAPHGGSGSVSMRFWQPYASLPGFSSTSADRFTVMAPWKHHIVHLGRDLRYDLLCFPSASPDSCLVLWSHWLLLSLLELPDSETEVTLAAELAGYLRWERIHLGEL